MSHHGADDVALAHLSRADPVLARLICCQPGLNPRAWLDDLPAMDAFGALIFQVAGQQLSVRATRRIIDRLQGEILPGDLALRRAIEHAHRLGHLPRSTPAVNVGT